MCIRDSPSFIVGSALTGALVGMAGIKLMAPHGGIFVVALTSNALLYLLFILIGAVVSGILFGFLQMCIRDRVNTEEELAPAFESASQEAKAAFGNGAMYIEKVIYPARHIEVQILGDS